MFIDYDPRSGGGQVAQPILSAKHGGTQKSLTCNKWEQGEGGISAPCHGAWLFPINNYPVGNPCRICKNSGLHHAAVRKPYEDTAWEVPAEVAELADALDLGSSAARRGGSSPPFRIEATPLGIARGQPPRRGLRGEILPAGRTGPRTTRAGISPAPGGRAPNRDHGVVPRD